MTLTEMNKLSQKDLVKAVLKEAGASKTDLKLVDKIKFPKMGKKRKAQLNADCKLMLEDCKNLFG